MARSVILRIATNCSSCQVARLSCGCQHSNHRSRDRSYPPSHAWPSSRKKGGSLRWLLFVAVHCLHVLRRLGGRRALSSLSHHAGTDDFPASTSDERSHNHGTRQGKFCAPGNGVVGPAERRMVSPSSSGQVCGVHDSRRVAGCFRDGPSHADSHEASWVATRQQWYEGRGLQSRGHQRAL